MARTLKFSIHDSEYPVVPTKIDRKKLYGWTETLALVDSGNECRLVCADESGTMIIPAGGTGFGILSANGKWYNRSQLQAVGENGEPADLIPSSFNVTIPLQRKVTPEEYLDHSITAAYQLDDVAPVLLNAVETDIYIFTYTYRDACEENPAKRTFGNRN